MPVDNSGLLSLSRSSQNPFEAFLRASVLLTGFSRFDLLGTGLADVYYRFILENAESADSENGTMAQLCQCVDALPTEEPDRGNRVQTDILVDPMLGPLARSVIKLWYLGQWFPPSSSSANPVILSSESYQEGLVWRAIGAHPSGAKEQGFGAWSLPPVQGANKPQNQVNEGGA